MVKLLYLKKKTLKTFKLTCAGVKRSIPYFNRGLICRICVHSTTMFKACKAAHITPSYTMVKHKCTFKHNLSVKSAT